jgi:hypothetical protein
LKFLFDNNLPPSWPRAIGIICQSSRLSARVVEVVALREKFPQDTPDTEWLAALSKEGAWSVVSSDQFRSKAAERKLIRQHGLNVYVLPKIWQSQDNFAQIARLIDRWPMVVEHAHSMRSGLVEVPWRGAKLVQI